MKHQTIALFLPGHIISEGVKHYLGKLPADNFSIRELTENRLVEEVSRLCPSVLIADPILLGAADLEALRDETGGKMKILGVYSTALPIERVRRYDETISVYDSEEVILDTFRRCVMQKSEDDTPQTPELSQREKDVVVGIVKGLSNKEIATEMNVSVNTVMTHRRNIVSKLQIHSPAGITIYAIVSKLVSLDEIQANLPR